MKHLAVKKNKEIGKNALCRYFADSLEKKNNYPQIAKAYLNFILKKNYEIDEISLDLFLVDKPASYKSVCKKFLVFVQNLGINKVYDDGNEQKNAKKYGQDAAVTLFLDNAQIRNSSKETYGKALKELKNYLVENDLIFNRPAVIGFFNKLIDEKCSPYTLNTYLSVIRKFAEFCIEKREILHFEENKLRELQDILLLKNYRNKTAGNTYTKDSLSDAERTHLLSCVQNPRDKAMIALMSFQGLRTIELLRLEWKDIVEKKGNLFLAVLGKGVLEKELIPLTKTCLEILTDYKNTLNKTEGKMFALTDTRSVRAITKKWLKIAGLTGDKLSAHSLRHTTAQILTTDGVPKEMVKRFLRHQSELSTSVYTRKAEDEIFLNFNFENEKKEDEISPQSN